jgi:hypothetical protein
MKFGSITTPIVTDGLVFNTDAANRASTIPSDSTTKVYNTVDTSIEGTFQDNAQFTTSGSINTWEFDGVDEWIDFGDVLDLGTNSMTVGAWINAQDSGANQWIFTKARAAGQNYRFGAALYRAGVYVYNIRCFMQGNGGTDILPRTLTSYNFNEWRYITWVWDRDSSISLYNNGVQDTNLNGSSTISQWTGLDVQSSNPLRIASYTAGDNTGVFQPFKGYISTVHVYHRVLSPTEILHNYNALKSRFGL